MFTRFRHVSRCLSSVRSKTTVRAAAAVEARRLELEAQHEYYMKDSLDYYDKYFGGEDSVLKLQYNEEKGRHLIAKRDIKAGELVLHAKPYISSLHYEHVKDHCYHCLTELKEKHSCPDCNQVHYCSEQCKIAAEPFHHDSLECDNMKRFAEFIQKSNEPGEHARRKHKQLDPKSTQTYSFVLFLFKALGKRYLEQQGKDNAGNGYNYEDLFRLLSHRKELMREEETQRLIMNTQLIVQNAHGQVVDPKLLHGVDDLELYELISKERSNAVGITGAKPNRQAIESSPPGFISGDSNNILSTVGFAVYPSLSYMNHSCFPNCDLVESNMDCQVYAIQDIPKGDEATFCYILPDTTSQRRKHQLKEFFFFECECPPDCHKKQCNKRFIRDHYCKGCESAFMIPVPDQKRQVCYSCGRKTPVIN